MFISDNISIALPKNCFAKVKGDADSYHCWAHDEDLNIAAVLVKNDERSIRMLTSWHEAMEVDFVDGGCNDLVFPQWNRGWMANDQNCLNRLYSENAYFRRHMYIMSHPETFQYIGGANRSFITHLFSGSASHLSVGEQIIADAKRVISQEVYSYIAPYSSRKQWEKHIGGVVFGGASSGLGSVLDVSLLKSTLKDPKNESTVYRFGMYFSWRSYNSIALVHSNDGIEWSADPLVVLEGRSFLNTVNYWDSTVNRPFVMKYEGGGYRMYYTGQGYISAPVSTMTVGYSMIGLAESADGFHWNRRDSPVLMASEPWEKTNIMCSHVLHDKRTGMFRMWYRYLMKQNSTTSLFHLLYI